MGTATVTTKPKAETTPPGHAPRRHLAARMLVARLAWLHAGRPCWRAGAREGEGRVVWRLPDGAGEVVPEAAVLAAAQKTLYRLRQYPRAAAAVLGDADAWRASCQARLELAKRLAALRPVKAEAAPACLAELLLAEALCGGDPVPGPPSRLLARRAGGREAEAVRAAVSRVAEDAGLPAAVRALAGLTLGAMEAGIAVAHPAARRALDWARRHGLPSADPEAPAFVAAILASDFPRPALPSLSRHPLTPPPPLSQAKEGESETAARCRKRYEAGFVGTPSFTCERGGGGVRGCRESDGRGAGGLAASWAALPAGHARVALGRRLVGEGHSAAEVAEGLVALAEGLDAVAAAGLFSYRAELPDDNRSTRRRAERRRQGDEMRPRRAELEAAFVQQAETALEGGMLPALRAFFDAARTVSDVIPREAGLARAAFVVQALAEAGSLPPRLRAAFFGLLSRHAGWVWDPAAEPGRNARPDPTRAVAETITWAQGRGERRALPLRNLLAALEDPAPVDEAVRLGVGDALGREVARSWHEDRWDGERCRCLLAVARRLTKDGTGDASVPDAAYHAVRHWGAAEARRVLVPLTAALRRAIPDADLAAETLGRLLYALPHTQEARQRVAARLVRHAPHLADAWAGFRTDAAEPYMTGIAQSVVTLETACPERADERLRALLPVAVEVWEEAAGDEDAPWRFSYDWPHAVSVAARLAPPDAGPETFAAFARARYRTLEERTQTTDRQWVNDGLDALDRCPGVRAALAARFLAQPRRCAALLGRLGMARRLGPAALERLAAAGFDGVGSADGTAAADPAAGDGWAAALELAPQAAPAAAAYWHACWLRGVPAELPAGVRDALGETAKRAAELAYLDALCDREGGAAAPGPRARRDSLRERLERPDGLRARTAGEVRERLEAAAAEAQLAALDAEISACFRDRLAELAGPLPPGAASGDDRDDCEAAALLSVTISSNRKLLTRLIRARLAGNAAEWLDALPPNAAFLRRLSESGTDPAVWLGAHPRRVRCPQAAGGVLRLSLETDPLAVLRMGSHVGSCLTVGTGCNAFSTVANAVDRNKRVLYVRDASGRVVGRKLLAVAEDGETGALSLVGFHAYTVLRDDQGGAELRAAVRRYAADFAARCNLARADAGDIPRLAAEDWYDDGASAWAEEGAGHSQMRDDSHRMPPSPCGTVHPKPPAPIRDGGTRGKTRR